MTPNILLLLVEDEPLIRMNLEEELADAGFEVVVATDGKKAMAELGSGPVTALVFQRLS